MSENEGGDSRFLTGFLVGFLVGVLLAIGVGGSFVIFHTRQDAMRTEAAMQDVEAAREASKMELRRAEAERARALKAKKDK